MATASIYQALKRAVDALFGALSMAVLLAIAVTTPVVQFFALGAMMRAAVRVARTGRLRRAFDGVHEASRLGQLAFGMWLVWLPVRFTISLGSDARLIDPSRVGADGISRLSAAFMVVALGLTIVAALGGGRLVHFFRPIRAIRAIAADARRGDYGPRTWARLKAFVEAFAPVETFVLGVRVYVAIGAWLLLPTSLIALGRKGPIAVLGGLALVVVLLHLPFLQIHFATEERWSAVVAVRTVRALFRRAPLAFAASVVSSLLLALPLYLLKVELVPRDALWLPAVVFLFTIFPTKLLSAWALHRARARPDDAHGVWRFLARLVMVPAAGFYALIVFLTQFTGWHGVLGMYEHHTFLLPVPF